MAKWCFVCAIEGSEISDHSHILDLILKGGSGLFALRPIRETVDLTRGLMGDRLLCTLCRIEGKVEIFFQRLQSLLCVDAHAHECIPC